MIILDKGIIMIMGTNDVYDCHWVHAVMKEIDTKKLNYGIYYEEAPVENINKIVSI